MVIVTNICFYVYLCLYWLYGIIRILEALSVLIFRKRLGPATVELSSFIYFTCQKQNPWLALTGPLGFAQLWIQKF